MGQLFDNNITHELRIVNMIMDGRMLAKHTNRDKYTIKFFWNIKFEVQFERLIIGYIYIYISLLQCFISNDATMRLFHQEQT